MDLAHETIVAFASELGWMSMRMRDEVILQLTFGHESSELAIQAIAKGRTASRKLGSGQREVVSQLQQYARGIPVDFSVITIDLGPATEFTSRVLNACRRISYGETLTYGELARAAGGPGAARAVGNCMACNRVPLIIPCHRVVRAGGQVGPYSAAGGSATKRRLLEMEGALHFLGSPRQELASWARL